MKTEHNIQPPAESKISHFTPAQSVADNVALRHQLLLIEDVEPRAEIKVWSFFGLQLPAFF